VRPVAEADVLKPLPSSSPARAMAQLQLHTGMGPGEVCRLRLADLDRTGDVWLYRPARHKSGYK
jgi:integrase